jgi:methionyl-tRNA formyltransferase
VPSLEALIGATDVRLVVTQPDKPVGRGQKVASLPVKAAALAANIEVVQPSSLRKPPFADFLRERALAVDLIVVVAYGKILPPDLLAVPRLGVWNVHGSLLPKYRGAAPIQHALLDGERETGVTLMQMEAGLDTGPMLLARAIPITPGDTSGTLHETLAKIGAALLAEGLWAQAAGTLVATPQDDARATLAPMLDKEAGRVDFTLAAEQVRDRIRGVDPWPGAFTVVGGEVLKLWRARVEEAAAEPGSVPGSVPASVPGSVMGVSSEGLRVACGRGQVTIAEGQLPGRKRMPMASLAAGRPIPRGTVLGA